MYNLNNVERQKRFKEYTSNTRILSSIFYILTQSLLKKLDSCIAMSFKKIRVSKYKETKQDELYKKRRVLKNKEDERSKVELNEVDKEIAQLVEDKYN